MKLGILVVAAAFAATVGGSAAIAAEQAGKKSKKALPTYEEWMDKCLSESKSWGYQEKHQLSALMRVPVEKVPETFCVRLARGIASGRISEKDKVALRRGSPTQLYRVLKGG